MTMDPMLQGAQIIRYGAGKVETGHEGGDATACSRPQSGFELLGTDVHVWRVQLGETGQCADSLWCLLDSEERARAKEMKGEERFRFVRCRATLRALLSHYSGSDPRRVELAYGLKGKPILADSGLQRKISFSVSHSYGVALYGFALDGEIGVDIERIRPLRDQEKLVRRFFSEGERTEYHRAPLTTRQTAFFRIWTVKEARSKMSGEGLTWGPRAAVDSTGLVCLQAESWRPEEVATKNRTSVIFLDVFPGFAAALAVEGAIRPVRVFAGPF